MIEKLKRLNLSVSYELIMISMLKFIIDFAHILTMTPNIPFSESNFNMSSYLIGWILTLLIYMILLYKKSIKIFIIFLLIYILYVIPNIVYYSFNDLSLLYLMYLLVPYILILISIRNYEFIKNVKFRINPQYVYILSILFSLITLFHLIYSTGGEYITDMSNIYEFREKYGVISNSGLWGYFNFWTFKVFSLFILLWSLYYKKYLTVFFSLLIISLLFIFTGHKSVFLSLFLVFFFFIIYQFNWNRVLVIASASLFFLSIIIFSYVTDDVWSKSIFLRRLLFVPTWINYHYFDFFSKNEFIYWSNGILKSFYEYPYEKHFAFTVGDYLNKPGMRANSGFIPMGFAHAGLLGIGLYTIIVSIILNIMNSFICEDTKFVKITLMFLPIYIFFTSSDLLTTLLTHGLFIVFLIVIFFQNNDTINNLSKE